MNTISSAYSELSKSKSEYVQFYMKNHEQIPTWIMIKVVNFSTFIDVLHNSIANIIHAICKLYSMYNAHNLPNVKLLIGSLHWLRRVRNSCAHNERIYCIHQTQVRNNSASGRILDPYYAQLLTSYSRCTEKNIFDILIYFKYFLPQKEFARMIMELKNMLIYLQSTLQSNAFDNVRGQMGIKNLNVLNTLIALPKSKIEYHKFYIINFIFGTVNTIFRYSIRLFQHTKRTFRFLGKPISAPSRSDLVVFKNLFVTVFAVL